MVALHTLSQVMIATVFKREHISYRSKGLLSDETRGQIGTQARFGPRTTKFSFRAHKGTAINSVQDAAKAMLWVQLFNSVASVAVGAISGQYVWTLLLGATTLLVTGPVGSQGDNYGEAIAATKELARLVGSVSLHPQSITDATLQRHLDKAGTLDESKVDPGSVASFGPFEAAVGAGNSRHLQSAETLSFPPGIHALRTGERGGATLFLKALTLQYRTKFPTAGLIRIGEQMLQLPKVPVETIREALVYTPPEPNRSNNKPHQIYGSLEGVFSRILANYEFHRDSRLVDLVRRYQGDGRLDEEESMALEYVHDFAFGRKNLLPAYQIPNERIRTLVSRLLSYGWISKDYALNLYIARLEKFGASSNSRLFSDQEIEEVKTCSDLSSLPPSLRARLRLHHDIFGNETTFPILICIDGTLDPLSDIEAEKVIALLTAHSQEYACAIVISTKSNSVLAAIKKSSGHRSQIFFHEKEEEGISIIHVSQRKASRADRKLPKAIQRQKRR